MKEKIVILADRSILSGLNLSFTHITNDKKKTKYKVVWDKLNIAIMSSASRVSVEFTAADRWKSYFIFLK